MSFLLLATLDRIRIRIRPPTPLMIFHLPSSPLNGRGGGGDVSTLDCGRFSLERVVWGSQFAFSEEDGVDMFPRDPPVLKYYGE